MKKLISISKETGTLVARFNISHNNKETTVDQNLILRKVNGGWIAEMPIEGMEEQKTVTAAAWKLGDWLERLGAEIKENTFDSLNLNDLDC